MTSITPTNTAADASETQRHAPVRAGRGASRRDCRSRAARPIARHYFIRNARTLIESRAVHPRIYNPLTPLSLAAGGRLGPYEIVSAVGAGGMGEVYRGRDPKLHRDVAIKVLPELFARDPERLARFEREAQVLASLNHPNIAHVYGIESGAIVMEFVGGEDLSATIARGPMPLADALPVARQIADALEAAHEQGVVHRDLKPA